MFCSKCGNQIDDDAIVCPKCGCATSNYHPASNKQGSQSVVEEEKSTLSTLSIVFAILMPIVGLILGIVGCCKYKNPQFKNKCIAAIPISIVVWAISYAVLLNM